MNQQLATTEEAQIITQSEPETRLEVQPPPGITASQAKVNAIADLTMKAYARASELNLTPEEIERLSAEFPDEAFRPGAAGKENLIYIEHAFLRDRLNTVIGVGQWAIVPRSRWTENYRTAKGQDAVRVYVEAMLLVRGCFVAESVGEMSYYPHNESQNYGDAVEGAKTAALRRCVKELGVGLQAWKKDFCEGWWSRRGNQSTRTASSPAATPARQNAQPIRPSAPPSGEPVTVIEVKEKVDPKWHLFVVCFSDGSKGSTFDKELGELAKALHASGELCIPSLVPSTKKPGSFDLKGINQGNAWTQPATGNASTAVADDDIPFN